MPESTRDPMPKADATPSEVAAGETRGKRTSATFARTGPEDVGQRQIYVSVDDGPKHALRFGASVTFELAPGPHTLRAHNTLYWKTVPFALDAGDQAQFVLVNKASRGALTFLTVFGVAPLTLVIERTDTPARPTERR